MKHLQFIAAFLLLMGVSYSSAAQSFSDPVQINADLSHVNSPSAVHVLDIDGDGDEDVLVASVISQSLGLFRNNGDATFGHEYLSQGKAWYAVSSTDWDGDGNLDVVGVRVFGNIKGIEVFHNLAGNGPADQFDNADIVNAWPYSAGNDALQVGDVDEDGNPEIYHFGNDGDEGGVLIAERVGDQVNAATYKVDLTPGSDNETYDGFLMDGNGDGSKDFFLNRTVNAQVFWIAFNGTNINGLPVADVTTTYEGPAFCCSAGPKLASSSVFTTTGNQGSIKHWQYNGLNAGDGSDWTTETALSGNGFNAERAQTYLNYTWVDVDGDGNKDLLIGDPTNDTILYWPNNGNADFGDAFTIGDSQILATNIAYPSFLDFVDLNGDNAKDILFVDSVGDQLFWLESQVAPAAETTTITANPIAITADGQSTSTITVQAKDANGNNLAAGGDAVVLATTLGALGAVADNNDGTYTATLTAGVVAGTATITGTINGAAITDDADVTLNVGAAGSSVSLVQTSTTPDGDSVYTITIAVTDSDGNNVGTGGDDVSIASTVGVLSEVIDNQDGTYTATLTTSPQEGMAVITITVNGADNSTSTEVTLGPGDANAGRTTISANPLSIVADGQSTSTITIQAKDADGHNLADGGDAVVLATTLGSLGSVVDNLDGTYTATLTAGLQAGTAQIVGFINSDLISSTAQISFTEPNSAPVAVIEASVTSGRAPLEVILDGHSSSDANGDLLTYEWDLGDGTSSQEILITHIFEEGIFDVLLVVSDGNLTDSASVIIEVDMANIAPEAVITASSYVGQAPFLVDFSASASSDANGDSLGFSWDMGDGATRIGESVSHTYGAPGLFTVVLTVTDGSLSDNAEAEISVASGVSVEDSKLPAEVVLKAIYPNPFNLTTMVTYGLPSASKVRITATDLLGRQVATLVAGDMKAAGYHTVQLNADGLASGTYLILIEAGDFVASQQVVLLK